MQNMILYQDIEEEEEFLLKLPSIERIVYHIQSLYSLVLNDECDIQLKMNLGSII